MANDVTASGTDGTVVDPSLITYTQIIYALHAFAVVVGIVTSGTIVLNFLFGIPSIIAVIMNYVRRPAVRGTFLDSHFSWQIRTFWYTMLWSAVVALISAPLALILIGFATWFIGFLLISAWIIYRVVRGWIRLRDRRPMYA